MTTPTTKKRMTATQRRPARVETERIKQTDPMPGQSKATAAESSDAPNGSNEDATMDEDFKLAIMLFLQDQQITSVANSAVHSTEKKQDEVKHIEQALQEDKDGCDKLQSPQFGSLASPWTRLVILLAFVVLSIIVLCAIQPMDRVLELMLPDFDDNSNVKALSQHQSDSSNLYSHDRGPPRDGFAFSQCPPNTTHKCCNGLKNACDLPISEVMFATVHNAHAAKSDGALLQPHHLFSLEQSLTAGYRGLHLKVCKCNGIYQFCHGICHLGARNPTQVLLNIDRFLKDHREEVILMELEFDNDAHQPVQLLEVYEMLQNATGLTRLLYSHPLDSQERNGTWPTLRQMIESDKRILLFYSGGPACADMDCPRGLHPWSNYAHETQVLALSDTVDSKMQSSCIITAEDNNNHEEKPFFRVNHFASEPNFGISERINEFSAVRARMQGCAAQHNDVSINLISSDFWHTGGVVEFVQRQARGT